MLPGLFLPLEAEMAQVKHYHIKTRAAVPKRSYQWPNKKPSPSLEGKAGLGALPLVLQYSASTGCSKPQAHVMISAHYRTIRSCFLHTFACWHTVGIVSGQRQNILRQFEFMLLKLCSKKMVTSPKYCTSITCVWQLGECCSLSNECVNRYKILPDGSKREKDALGYHSTLCAEQGWWLCCTVSWSGALKTAQE